MKIIDYYNMHSDQFAESTFNVDMESLYQPFYSTCQAQQEYWIYAVDKEEIALLLKRRVMRLTRATTLKNLLKKRMSYLVLMYDTKVFII